MKKVQMFVLFTLAAFVPLALNAQLLGIPGMARVNQEYWARQAYAPVDRIVGALGPGGYYGGGYAPGFGSNRFAAIVGETAVVVGLEVYASRPRGPKLRDCSKKKPGDRKCDAALQAAKQQAELAERQLRGGYLRNGSSRWLLEVKDCNSRVAVLKPGQRAPALGARCGYEGTFFVRSASVAGLADEEQAAFIVSDDAGGWVFHVPAVQKGGR